MKYKLSVLFSLFILAINAQNPFLDDVVWSSPFKKSAVIANDHRPIGSIKNDLYVLNNTGFYKYGIDVYDKKTSTLKSSHTFKLKFNDQNLILQQAFIVKDSVVFISQYRDFSKNTLNFLIQTYLGDGKYSNPKLIAEISLSEIGTSITDEKGLRNMDLYINAFKIVQSKNKKYLFALYQESIDEFAKGLWTAKIFDENLNETPVFEFNLPDDRVTLLEKIAVSNEGIGFVLGRHQQTITYKPEFVECYFYSGNDIHYIIIDPFKGNVISEEAPTPENEDVVEIGISVINNDAILYGLYGDFEEKEVFGTFFTKFSADGDIVFDTTNEFKPEFVTQYWSEKQKKKNTENKIRFKEYSLRDLQILENGDLVLVAEHFFKLGSKGSFTNGPSSFGGMGTPSTLRILYGDVALVYCSSNGRIQWNSLVKKAQLEGADGNSSFFSFSKGENVHVVFNTTEEQMNQAIYEGESFFKGNYTYDIDIVCNVAIDKIGKQTKEILYVFPEKDKRFIIAPSCTKIADDEILLFTEMKKRMVQLGVVKI